MIVTAAIAWALLASGIAIYACFQMAGAQAEARRQKAWATHWRQQAEAVAGVLARRESSSRRGSHARACQVDRERALVRQTAERLRAGK